jgi:large subunit ribosomal protein L3
MANEIEKRATCMMVTMILIIQCEVIMANENMGLLGYKVGMTQIYNDKNGVIPVTVIDVSENTVLRVKTSESSDGYNAVQVGVGTRKEKHTSKPMQQVFTNLNVSPKKDIKEFRVNSEDAKKYNSGQSIGADLFAVGQQVDVTGTSKGRGFAGVMKKYNFKGFIRSHGTHEYFRHGGSIGTRLTPGHVIKGKKMPGHMGHERVTVQNLTVEKVDTERNLIFIRGGVPGPNKGLLIIRNAVK